MADIEKSRDFSVGVSFIFERPVPKRTDFSLSIVVTGALNFLPLWGQTSKKNGKFV